MPRPATIEALQDFPERDPDLPQNIDYDAEYRVLDLPPGAALWEIQDRARLLSAAFHPVRLPGGLRASSAQRAVLIIRAADRLSRYWRTHGAPPPRGRAERAEGFAAAPVVERRAPQLRLVTKTAQLQASSDTPRPSGAGRSAASRPAIPSRNTAEPLRRRFEEPRKRRPLAVAGSVLVKLALAALFIAAMVRVQQYRADHPSLGPYSDPRAVTPVGMPGEPPVRWAGLPVAGRQMIGAAAPAIMGRQRQD